LPSSLLNIFKLVFLALLWLFFLRVLRAVWVSVREPAASAAPNGATPAPITGVKRGEAPASPGSLKVVEPPEQRGRVYPLTNEVTIGRGGGCGVALADDRMVSQLHARIYRGDDGRFFVEDLGSTNGTTLNRSKVSGPVVMKPGDRVQVGRTVLEVGGPVPARSGG
jgi:pSer/pThr/pTyr-binding forkhead associated (FHA) protein